MEIEAETPLTLLGLHLRAPAALVTAQSFLACLNSQMLPLKQGQRLRVPVIIPQLALLLEGGLLSLHLGTW